MGEAKRRQYNRRQFLLEHPICIYCGAPATTTDHCPPRCVFLRRYWPEGYEFPCCDACNQEARLDEQALAVLVRIELNNDSTEPGKTEWEKLVKGVGNNQPALLAEWTAMSRNRHRRIMREAFGDDLGDKMRDEGWGSINLGELTRDLLNRFMVKLGKALYYKHNNSIFEGTIYAAHISIFSKDSAPEFFY